MNEEDYLEKLVSFRSVSTDKSESMKCAAYCHDFFESSGLHSKIIEYDGYPNVVATTRKTKKPKIFLQSHMDVVPAKAEMFELKKAGGKLIGRGVFDMKFACACFMKIIDKLADDLDQYDFGVMLSFDEEIGGRRGVDALLNDGYGCEVCILPDSGQGWNLECSAKGVWFIKISKTGKNAHASLPFEGINAAELLISAITEIIALRESYEYENLSLNFTKSKAGSAMNQIPNYAEATFDIRYKSLAIFNKIREQIREICFKYDIKLETIELGKCVNVSKDNDYLKKFTPVAEKVLERKINYADSAGATDARYFCERGIPSIVIQPNGGAKHGDHEWIEAGGMEKLTEICLRYIQQCAKISPE